MSEKLVRQSMKASERAMPSEKWTDEEFKKFVEGLMLFGRDWRMVAQYIGTKDFK